MSGKRAGARSSARRTARETRRPARMCGSPLHGCARRAEEDAGGAHPVVPVRVQRLEQRSVVPRVTVQGQWRLSDSLVVASPFRAYVESMRPRAGDRVEKGAAIGRLSRTVARRAPRRGNLDSTGSHAGRARRGGARAAARGARSDPGAAGSACHGTVLRRSVEPGSEVAESASSSRSPSTDPWSSRPTCRGLTLRA